jgi:hypothetical protein
MEEKYDSVISNGDQIEVTDEIERAYSTVRRPILLPNQLVVSLDSKKYFFTNETSISRFYNRITQSNSDITLRNALDLADLFLYDPQNRELSKLSPLRTKFAKTHEGTKYIISSKYSLDSPLVSYVKINNQTK